MKKKVFSLMMTLLLAASGFVRADELTVHDGTVTSGFVPVYGFYADAYNRCEMVYPAAELSDMNGGSISSLKFYATQGSVNWGNAIFQVYVAEVASATLGDNFVGQGTNVYQGALSISGNQMVVTFTTPYTYNGGNLLIGIAQTTKGTYVTSTWNGETVNGASITNYNYTSLSDIYSGTQRNFLPKTTFTYTAGGGETPGGGGSSDDPEAGLHVVYDNGEARELVIDELYLGEYPAGAWMQPFQFKMYNNDTQALTVSVLDFTPNTDALSMAEGTVLPFTVAANAADSVDLAIQVQAPADAEAGGYEYQFVAIYEGSRLAKIWPLSFTIYTPEVPDVVEKAYDLGTIGNGYTYTGVPSDITPTVLHNDYTLPFPEIPEGNDAVYKFKVEGDMIISAYVDETNADGKVALYTEDFNGEAGPMATNNYTGLTRANAFGRTEVTVHDGTVTNGYIPTNGINHDNYCKSEFVYPASDLGEMNGCDITSMKFYVSYPGSIQDGWNSTQRVFVKEVADASISAFQGETGATVVFEGNLTAPTAEGDEMEITFNTPYHYNGGNLLVGVYNITKGTWQSVSYYGENVAGASISGYNGSSLANITPSQRNFLPKTTFNYTSGGGTGGSTLANVNAGPVIENLPIQAGTYYLVASSTDADYTVYINAADMPCPAIDAEGFAFTPQPADDADSIQPASVTLRWVNPEYATGWRLVFGSTYYPEAGHPQTVIYPEDGSFSTEMANSYTVTNLWNNTNYFWHVEFNNGACPDGVSSPIWGFTTTLNAPRNLVANPEQIFEGETTTLTWNAIVDRTYRQYRVYQDGVMIHEFDPTTNPEANLTYTVTGLTYNPTGYVFNVTAVYDEGESPYSNDAIVKVSGFSAEPGIYGYVYEQDSVTPIGGVTVTVTGTDEFGNAVNHSATTNAEGYYSINPVEVGTYATAEATCNGYVSNDTPYTNWPPITIAYQGSWGPMNFILQEEFYPSPLVCAETVQVGDDELVKVWWRIPDGTGSGSGTGGGGGTGTGNLPITQGFEDGLGDWTIVNGVTGFFSTGVTTQFTPHSGNALFMFYFTTNPPQYLISPMLTGTENGVDVSFYHSARSAYWQETFQVGYSTTTNDVDAFVFGPEITSNPIAYEEYTNSFPAGTKYVAVKCTSNNAFGLWIDDISISASGRGITADRALHHYRIYRTNCYYDGPYYEGDPGGTVVLASAWVPDTAYFDVSWPDAAPGVYKWGVGVVYEGNHAGNPNNPRESQITWNSNHVNGDRTGLTPRTFEVLPNANINSNAQDLGRVIRGSNAYGMNLLPAYFGVIVPEGLLSFDVDNIGDAVAINSLAEIGGGAYDITTGHLYMSSYTDYKVYEIDPETGNVLNTVNTDFGLISLCTDPTTGTIYSVDDYGYLMILDPATGDLTDVGVLNDGLIGSIACNSSGQLYGLGFGFPAELYTINKTDASQNLLGTLDQDASYAQSMAFDASNNKLYWAQISDADDFNFYEINVNTLTTTLLAANTGEITGLVIPSSGSVTPTPTPTPGNADCNNLLALPRESCTAWSNDCSPCIDKDMYIEVSVNVLLNSADSPEGTTVGFTNLNPIEQDMHPQDMLTLDDSGYHLFDSFRRGTYAIEVRHEGYYTIHDTVNIGFDPNDTRELRYVMEEILYPVRDLYISRTGWAMWERESGWEDGEPTRHFNYYKVMCTSIDGEPIFNKNTEHPFCQVETSELVEGNYYICKVACMFTTGLSAWTEQVFQYEPCDNWGPVDVVTFNPANNGNHIAWTFDHGHNQWIDLDSVAPAKGGVVNNYKDQPVYSQYADNGYMLNFFGIKNVYFRSYLLYMLTNDDRFVLTADNDFGQFIVTPSDEDGNFAEEFETFYQTAETDFSMFTKDVVANRMDLWKSSVVPTHHMSIMMDVIANGTRVDNDQCINSLPFCTTEAITFPAATGAQNAQENADYGCMLSSPNPAWYHMRIQTGGPFVIHMEADNIYGDIDFVIWGPFTDPTEPCFDQLTSDKIIDCSFSIYPVEDCYLGYPEEQHDHGSTSLADGTINYHVPEAGEYYILLITNYDNQPCNISFTKTEGDGETDCEIVAPTNIIGFLITQDGEYLDFVGPDERDYTHVGEFGDHEYCVRPIYPGPAILPDTNYYWCMGCPVCVTTNGGGGGGEEICEPVSNLTGYYLNYNGQEGLVLDWEEPEGATTVRIYADDEYVGEAPASSHPIFLGFDGEVPEHTFALGVVAVHADCESEMVTVNVHYDDVNENDGQLAIFPNPTNGNVKIMANAMRHITVVSVLGQVVYDADVNADEMDLNMGQWNAGVYVVRIVTETGIHTQRVTVVR